MTIVLVSFRVLFCFSLAVFGSVSIAENLPARVGSKVFTEGYILAEILAVQSEKNNFTVDRRGGLGATGVTEAAMKNREIDLIVDYTGNVAKTFLNHHGAITVVDMNIRLKPLGFEVSKSLGFNNTFALAVKRAWSEKNQIFTISDLRKMKSLKAAFTPEFANRAENWVDLKKAYTLNQVSVLEMDHQLAYEAIKNGAVELMEAYSTDAKLKEYDLVTLKDDLDFFPNYDAVIMTHLLWKDKNPTQWQVLKQLEGKISAQTMIALNSEADLEKKSFNQIASKFLNIEPTSNTNAVIRELLSATREHLVLVLVPVFLALLCGLPLAYLAYKLPRLQAGIGAIASLFQTVPSLAFLALLIPVFGIGTFPAIIVLALYALLPIFISSLQGFNAIPASTHLVCHSLKLRPLFRFQKIELALAWPGILSGIQTALIATVATATLAALVGAGGYGKKIIAGLAVNDTNIILAGAIPAALLALAFQLIFQVLNGRIRR
jgi:osmoprotectant transport system permease protein